MTSRRLTTLSIFIIIAIIGLCTWQLSGRSNKTIHNSATNQLEGYVLDVTQRRFDKAGKITSTFYAPKILEYTTHQTALIDQPKLISHAKQADWILTADHGKSIKNGNIITVWGNVIIKQPKTKRTPKTIIKTSHATIYPQQSLAKTAAHVTIERPGTEISGIGAIANLKSGTVTLLSHSRGHYVPTSH